MSYLLTGDFVEACDCTLMCPCWTDDEPDEGHCTGFLAWSVDAGTIDLGQGPVTVSGAKVVALTVHAGRRRPARERAYSVLFVDTTAGAAELRAVFAGRCAGPMRDLAEVNGTVVDARDASIGVDTVGGWTTVTVQTGGLEALRAVLRPTGFDGGPPLELTHSALDAELQAQGPVVAHHTERLSVRVPALPGGWLEVTGRSGMRGTFRYVHP